MSLSKKFARTDAPFALTLALSFALAVALAPAALAESLALEVHGPSMILLESPSAASLSLTTNDLQLLTLESSPTRRLLFADRGGSLFVEAAGTQVIATIQSLRVVEQRIHDRERLALARSLFAVESATKEEDHDFDPDPKLTAPSPWLGLATKEEDHDFDPDPKRAAAQPLVTLLSELAADFTAATKEEDHDFDPDPNNQPPLADAHRLAAAGLAALGPGWYVVVDRDAVSFEVLADGR
ncbi:MAG: hypothetical protein AAGC60_25650 [Acidobacteriota bacterium]